LDVLERVKEKHHICSWNYKYGADRVLSLESEHFYLSIKSLKLQSKFQ